MCGTTNNWNCIAHFLDPYARGVILDEFGVMESTKQEIEAKFGVPGIPVVQENVPGPVLDEDDEDPTESLLRRRRMSSEVNQNHPTPCSLEIAR